MPDNYYIIGRHVFDIRFTREEEAYALQNRFSRLFYQETLPLMEAVFERLVPDDIPLRVDQLVLDIGHIRYDRLEKDFGPRFREALEKELEQLLDQKAGRQAGEWLTPLTGLLEHFLLTGSLPWWAAGNWFPSEVVNRLLQEHPEELAILIRRAGRHEAVRERVAWQLPADVIHALIRLLEPEEAGFIIAYHADIIVINETRKLVHQPGSDLEKTLWVFVLTYLLADRGSYFNRKAFVRNTLEQMARSFNQAYAGLLEFLFRVLEDYKPDWLRTSALPGIIQSLYEEEQKASQQPLVQDEAGVLRQKMEVLRKYLLQGHIAGQLQGHTAGQTLQYDATGLSDIFIEIIEKLPESTMVMLYHLAGLSDTWKKIAGTFTETVLTALVRLKEPGEADFILHYSHKLEWLQREKQLVKTESSSFHQSVWELILSFLWMERGNVFNTRTFLEYNIRRMARRYLLSYKQLLAFLVQGIGQDIRSEKDSSLFHMLVLLLRESKEVTALPAIAENSQTHAKDISDKNPEELLRYWMLYGSYPSLSAPGEQQTSEQLWATLLESNPRYLATFLQSTGTTPALRERIISRLPVERLLPVIRLLPDGSRVLQLLEEIMHLAAGSAFTSLEGNTLQSVLLALVWETYASNNYRYFDEQIFIKKALHRLSAGMARKGGEWVAENEEKEAGPAAIRHWIAGFHQEERLQQLVAMLSAYLLDGQWPAEWPSAGVEEQETLLIQVLHWLLVRKPHALAKLMQQVQRQGNETARKKLQRSLRTIFRSTAAARQLLVRHDGEALMETMIRFMYSLEEGGAETHALSPKAASPEDIAGSAGLAAIDEELRRRAAREKEILLREETILKQIGEDPLYIGNAGLVLLHPLLPHFFGQLELTEKNGFRGREAQHRSVLLLQCLVNGREEHPEQELTLNKILCNLDPITPVPSVIICTDAEHRLMDQLWEALRQHWKKMMNTSAEGFRVSFLQRPGALTQTPEGWKLRVEQRGIDVLLHYLPWGWSMIKLPWMDKTLYVEWT